MKTETQNNFCIFCDTRYKRGSLRIGMCWVCPRCHVAFKTQDGLSYYHFTDDLHWNKIPEGTLMVSPQTSHHL